LKVIKITPKANCTQLLNMWKLSCILWYDVFVS